MKIGQLKEPIEILSYTTTPDGAGGTFAQEQILYSTWAKVTPQGGTRKISGGEQVLEDGAIFRIRRNTEHSLDKSYRIVWRGDTYQIHSIIEEDAAKWIWKIEAKRLGDGFYSVLGTENENEALVDENNNAIKIN